MATAAVPSQYSSVGIRPRQTRCKTGCRCCRLRKKKCGEERPVCLNCKKLNLLCSWPDSKEFAWRIRMGLSSSNRISTPDEPDISPITEIEEGEEERKARRLAERERVMEMVFANSPLLTSTIQIRLPYLPTTAPGESHAMSQRFLQLYIDRTVPALHWTPPGSANPFLQHVIPLVFQDTLIMNAVLAVGGISGALGEEDSKAEAQRLHCYGQAIKELKLALTNWSSGNGPEAVRLLLATILLCLHECIRGNEGGTLWQHLRASRFFAGAVLTVDQDAYSSDLVGVLLEFYAYYELCSSLRILPEYDDIEAACQFSSLHLDKICDYKTFGAFFGSSLALYRTIPFICQLAMDRKCEMAEDIGMGCHSTFERLKDIIQGWKCSGGIYNKNYNNQQDGDVAAGKIVRNALLLFLYSSYYHDTIYLRKISEPLVDETVELLSVAAKLPWLNSIYWPMVVVATYATKADQQRKLLAALPLGILLVSRTITTLKWLWDEPDDIFGLDGLAKVTKAHGTNVLFG